MKTTAAFLTFLKYAIAFIIGFAVAWWSRGCQRCPDAEPVPAKSDTVTQTIWDTVTFTKNVIKPVPCYRIVDSAAVYFAIKSKTQKEIEDFYLSYFTENVYDTTVRNDTSAFIRLRARTWQNQLELIGVDFINRRPTAINTSVTNHIDGRRVHWLLGAGASYHMDGVPVSFHLSAGFVNRKHFGLTVSADPFKRAFWATGYCNLYRK